MFMVELQSVKVVIEILIHFKPYRIGTVVKICFGLNFRGYPVKDLQGN